MKLLVASAVVLAARVAALLVLDPFGDDSGSPADSAARTQPLTGTPCQRLAGLAANLAVRDRTAEHFLTALGRQGRGSGPVASSIGFSVSLKGGPGIVEPKPLRWRGAQLILE